MNRLSIGKRLFAGFALILAMTAFSGIFAIIDLNNIAGQIEKLYRHPFTVSLAVRDIHSEMLSMTLTMKTLMFDPSAESIRGAKASFAESEGRMHKDFDVVFERFLGNKELTKAAHASFLKWKAIRDEQLDLLQRGNVKDAIVMHQSLATPLVDTINRSVEAMIVFAQNKAGEFQQNAQEINSRAVSLLEFLVGATIFFGLIVAFFIGRSISRPISGLIPLAADIAAGRPVEPRATDRRDEIGLLVESFGRIISSNKSIVSQANAISRGDYSVVIKPRSDNDELGLSLAKMTETLACITETNKQESWLKTGQSELNDTMRGNQDVATLCDKI
ncbi:MAG: methyl-accepting chemotaxis protein, partial [Pseudomonadota bacterium]